MIRQRAVLVVLALLWGCAPNEPANRSSEDGPLAVAIEASSTTFSPVNPVTLTVTIENRGNSTARFGSGSSSCQLNVFVVLDGQEVPIADDRPCTMDLVQHAVEAGKRRSERLTWGGDAIVQGSRRRLEPGVYEVRGGIGRFRSAPLAIELAP